VQYWRQLNINSSSFLLKIAVEVINQMEQILRGLDLQGFSVGLREECINVDDFLCFSNERIYSQHT
jgi:hypothetical protein